jgi:small GTP-binding protein
MTIMRTIIRSVALTTVSVLLAQDVESFSSSSVMMPSRSSSSMTRGRPDPDDRTLYICLFIGNRGTSSTRILSTVSDEEAELLLADFYDEVDLEEEEGDGGTTREYQRQRQQQQQPQQQQSVRRFKRPKKVPLIAVVGRPNVGKSALVNRLAGTQSGGAIVADEEGITRDRTYRNAEFLGEDFQLVDTGGLVFDDDDAIFAKEIREQAMIAIEESSGVILVVDGQVGPTAMDEQLASFLRTSVTKRMPVVLAVNKCESDKNGAYLASQFWNLGLGEPHAVSALHGVGTAELLEDVFEGIVEKGSAIRGFGTKVKEMEAAQRALIELDKAEPLEGEDETDMFLRMYGVGRTGDDVVRRYEEAMSAFDDVPTMVSGKNGGCFPPLYGMGICNGCILHFLVVLNNVV